MRIPLNPQGDVPLYKQIESYLRENILSGALLPETRLPATRQLAQSLGVSRITVSNAYAELESDGLIYSMEGSGTFVMAPIPNIYQPLDDSAHSWPLWQEDMRANRGLSFPGSLPVTAGNSPHPAPITFTGVGDPRQFPVKDFYSVLRTVIQRDGIDALGYGSFDGGYRPLRETISHVLASQGIRANPDTILITSGSQQAIALVCQLLLKAGDVILVEDPGYNYALELFQSLKLKVVGVPVDEQGMRIDLVESLLQKHHPRLVYTIPNFQNPTGTCLSTVRRRELLVLAGRYNIPILEDDFVGDLRYDGRAQPAIKALDQNGSVIYAGTFSKMLMPGLRVGYLVADGPVFDRLLHFKHINDLTTSNLMQRVLEEYVTVGRYQQHLRRSGRLYRKRRDAMLEAIKHHLPNNVEVHPPQGGLFIWLRLPEGVSSNELLPIALKEGVAFAPGRHFFLDHTMGEPYLRLNFAVQTVDDIDVGIQRLARALERLAKNAG